MQTAASIIDPIPASGEVLPAKAVVHCAAAINNLPGRGLSVT